MQAFNPDLHLLQVEELFFLVEDSPAVFVGLLREELVVLALQHATSVVDRTTMPGTAKRRL